MNQNIYISSFLGNLPWAGARLTIPPGLCVPNTTPSAILPAASEILLKHLIILSLLAMVLAGLSSSPLPTLSLARHPWLVANFFVKTARNLAAQKSPAPGRKVSFVKAFGWYKVGKFGHQKAQNATSHQARNSSQKHLSAAYVRVLCCAQM